jgi:hypothetical protein
LADVSAGPIISGEIRNDNDNNDNQYNKNIIIAKVVANKTT